MIGLEHICKIFECEYKELAEKMNISQPTIQDWLKKRRNIPKSRIEQLSEIFKNIPPEYFQKELRKSEELEVQMIYLQQTDTSETVEVPVTDENGKIVGWREESYSANAGVINHLNDAQDIVLIMERVKDLIEEDEDDETARRLLHQLLDTIKFGEEDQKDFLKELFQYLNVEGYSDLTGKYEELKQHLQKNNLLKKQNKDEEK